jgi:hypothetical protein
VAVDIHDGFIWVRLYDGRIIANPLDWYPALANASIEQQSNFQISPVGMEWPELGVSLTIRAMLRPRR